MSAVRFDTTICTVSSHVCSVAMVSAPALQRLQSDLWPHTSLRLLPCWPQPKLELPFVSKLREVDLPSDVSREAQ